MQGGHNPDYKLSRGGWTLVWKMTTMLEPGLSNVPSSCLSSAFSGLRDSVLWTRYASTNTFWWFLALAC